VVSVRDEISNLHNQCLKRAILCTHFARYLLKESRVKLVRDPISVGIDPERELSSVVFCGVGNTIEMVINVVVSVRDESSNHHNQLCTYVCTTLTKVKSSQACKRSDLSWNRPSKGVKSCIFCGVRNTIEMVSNVVSMLRDESRWHS
jgi:hypothetical protein